MRIAIILGAAVVMAVPVLAQPSFVAAPPPSKPSAISTQSPASAVSPTLCAERNKYLRDKAIPALKSELVSLQAAVRERKSVTFVCRDETTSASADGKTVISCGIYRCNPIDGLCRDSAKTSADCAPGLNWDRPHACVPR